MPDAVKQSLTILLSLKDGLVGVVKWSSSMGRMSPHAPISRASRRRLARCLVGSPIRDVERDLVLETLANTDGNRTESARLLGVSLRTLRNRITKYAADGIDVPRHAAQSAP
jgi:DNA-binding NtrC family response regulator